LGVAGVLAAPASPLARADLAVGDIVLAVNDLPLARPEHVMTVWQALRTAPQLRCEVWRGQGQLVLQFAIAPAATAGAASTPATPSKSGDNRGYKSGDKNLRPGSPTAPAASSR
ncbi:MAG TPA: hypothetical protein PKU97_23680, partial [Kofleriaceae bacterium]|nr:hypothetical protein [Kofleriaceae bacterium]